MLKKLKLLNVIIILFVVLVSCDTYNDVSYIVDNKTSDSVRLQFDYSEDYFGIETGDTIIFMAGQSQTILFIHTLISPSVYNPETEEKMLYIAHFDITRTKDSALILKDVTLRKNWKYTEKSENSAENVFTIYDSDF